MNSRELANSICDTLSRHGHQALLVGGCVRDLLLKREPADYDVTTDATPERVLQLFPESVGVGAQFGVVLVLRDAAKVEVATFRSDLGYSDGRHPDRVLYSKTPQEDVARRDFTINGLLMRHDTGEVLDYVGGQNDLHAGLVRAIGDPERRFTEDKLRMLRAIRFAARFAYAIEPATFAAIQEHAPEIHVVSPERIREELTKLLTEGAARRGFDLLYDSGLLQQLLPEISAMQGVPQPPEFHPEGDVWIHTRLMLAGLPAGVSPTLAWGVLLHDVGKPPTFRSAAATGDRIRFDGHAEVGVKMATAICHRLRFSNDDTQQILALVANHMKFKDVAQMRKSTLKRFVRLPGFSEHLELHRLDCQSSHGR
ncbi:MAG: CCA tRNA nucleotidyltransferase, partial [Candidatus Acidoferrales bacterium]|nr:CCA tRNA nucleotidyltransferase [Candidatus Acidoferrales bacterium]